MSHDPRPLRTQWKQRLTENNIDGVLSEITEERVRQCIRWDDGFLPPQQFVNILYEETGEVARAVNDHNMDNYREELIQTAAVAVRAVQCLDRHRNQQHKSFNDAEEGGGV